MFKFCAMATIKQLKKTLVKLENSRVTKRPTKLEKSRPVEKLIKILIDANMVELVKWKNDEMIVKVTNEAVKFDVVPGTVAAGRNDLLRWATLCMPTVTGNLIVYTRMGIQTHIQAVNSRIGGQIIGLVY